ncbi:MAG: glycosyltransferase family 61 protein [Bacteroidales bacterium]|nr:glycosyltransferase family 61 protein [Bacteroidales bacterium]
MNYLSSKYDLSVINYYLDTEFVKERKPEVNIYENGVLFPPGTNHKPGVFSAADASEVSVEINQAVVYLGCFDISHFGNILVDEISRLWYNNIEGVKWAFIATKRFDPKYLHIFLEFLGIEKDRVIRVSSPTRFSCIYVPAMTFLHRRFVLQEYSSIYERMFQNMKFKSEYETYEKIYLTRRKLRKKKEIGEWRFEFFFKSNGYKVIAPERLSIEQQALVMRNAQNIASIEGTHAHGVVWCRRANSNNMKQIILRKQSECIPRQMMLNQLWAIDTSFVDIFEEPFKRFPISHDRGPFLLRWSEQIEQFAKDNNMIVPKRCRYGFVQDYIGYVVKCFLYWMKHNLKSIMK